MFYQAFGEDAQPLAQMAEVPLRFEAGGLAVAEVPVLNCETTLERLAQRGFGIIIRDDK